MKKFLSFLPVLGLAAFLGCPPAETPPATEADPTAVVEEDTTVVEEEAPATTEEEAATDDVTEEAAP